jgi:hypothetical protein
MSSIASTDKFSVLVILRREYFDITGNFCAAKLIEYFRHWTKWKLKNHRTPWIYQPLKRIYADLMGEHSLHVIRSAIALLEEMGIISKQRNPGNGQDKTWQYKLHFEVLNRLLELRKCKTEPSTFNVEQHLRSDPKTSKPQQHAAVELKKDDEVEQTKTLEQALVTHFALKSELDYSSNNTGPHEGNSDAAAPTVQKTSDAIVSQPGLVVSTKRDWRTRRVSEKALVTRKVEEPELNDSADDEDQFSALGAENSGKPSKSEIAEICTELRRLRINPQPCLGVVKKHWASVQGAIARVKEAVQEGWCSNPTGLFINSCKSGAKGKNAVTTDVSAWFEWARKERIVLAMSGRVVYTPEGEAVELAEMMLRFPVEG